MEIDRNGLEVLERDECVRRLRSVPIARIALSMQALPVILPVNFVVDGDEIVIRTNLGSKAEAALQGTVVALEVDEYDTIGHTGWSVLVRGRTRLVDDPVEIERLHGLWVRAWGTPHTDRWMTVAMEIVTGRRIRHDLTRRPPPALVGDAFRFEPVEPAAEPVIPLELEWETWGMIRADHHTVAAPPRTTTARPNVVPRAFVADRLVQE